MHTLPLEPSGNQWHVPIRGKGSLGLVICDLGTVCLGKTNCSFLRNKQFTSFRNYVLADPQFYCITKGHTCLSPRIFPSGKQNTVRLCCSLFLECPCVLYLQGGHLAMIPNPWPLTSHLGPLQTPKRATQGESAGRRTLFIMLFLQTPLLGLSESLQRQKDT